MSPSAANRRPSRFMPLHRRHAPWRDCRRRPSDPPPASGRKCRQFSEIPIDVEAGKIKAALRHLGVVPVSGPRPATPDGRRGRPGGSEAPTRASHRGRHRRRTPAHLVSIGWVGPVEDPTLRHGGRRLGSVPRDDATHSCVTRSRSPRHLDTIRYSETVRALMDLQPCGEQGSARSTPAGPRGDGRGATESPPAAWPLAARAVGGSSRRLPNARPVEGPPTIDQRVRGPVREGRDGSEEERSRTTDRFESRRRKTR